MSDDPYEVLGLTKTATADEIKKAHRKLVRTSHPDIHPDDPDAELRFKRISAAYDLLKDPETRKRFDAGEIDASGAERAQHRDRRFYRDYAESPAGGGGPSGFGGFGGDPSDIFAEILRQRAGAGHHPGFSAPGPDSRYSLEVGFLEAALGAKTRITLPGGSNLEVSIPPGTADGQTLRLRGKGGQGVGGGAPGDALVTLSVRPHPVFQRDGDDILVTLPITLDEAVLGGKVAVPTIEGRVSVNIPKCASGGQLLRLRGRGLARKGGKRGDQKVDLRIVSPPQIDAELAAFMEGWREANAYDPRTELFEEGK